MLFWIVLLVGLGCAAWGTYARRRARAASSWPVTTALVIVSGVEERAAGDGAYVYYPVVRYRYQVGDAYHYSERRDATELGMGNRSAADAQWIVRQWPVGMTLEVRYDPAHPDDALPARGTTEVLADQGLVVQRFGLAVSALAVLFRLVV